MPADPHAEQFRMSLPTDLLLALDRRPLAPRDELCIDGLMRKPSVFGRLVERLIARRRR